MKIGILGGGQLGKMLIPPASQLDRDISFMDRMSEGPVSKISHQYNIGEINAYEDVLKFGADKDVLSIEIEKVNTQALKDLRAQGKLVYPQPEVIETIQDKGIQKQFYLDHDLPSSRFKCYDDLNQLKNDVKKGVRHFPFVQKMRKDGYDGRGVHVIKSEADYKDAFLTDFLVEDMVDIDKELAVVTCTDPFGNAVAYDPVEMVFHDEANILLYQLAPARISEHIMQEAKKLARRTAKAFGITGLLAVELFLNKNGEVIINEVAPRPHNSGHHTIEACHCSQYENQIRVLSHLPLGSTKTLKPSLLMNVLGHPEYTGPVHYEGLEKILEIDGVNVHIYGKTETKPFRKMGHINIVDDSYESLINKYNEINRTLQVISK